MLKIKNKKGVFGLNAVQTFFTVILGIALLAYVIVIIMGTLTGTTILQQVPVAHSGSVANEAYTPSTTGQHLSVWGLTGVVCTITSVQNFSTTGLLIGAGNYTQNPTCNLRNATGEFGDTGWKVNFTYTDTPLGNSPSQNNLNSILINTSTGITSFFGAINPVYAILAVLVIILVLVVLVRVVSAPSGGSTTQPQL